MLFKSSQARAAFSSMGNQILSGKRHWFREMRLHALGVLSLGAYGFVVFRLEAHGTARDITLFLLVFGLLFAAYGLAILHQGQRALTATPMRARTILGWAILFRVVMLFAGLPHQRALEAAWLDLTGRETTYTNFVLYDNDLWRYLWDGHVGAHGFNPYAVRVVP